MSSDDISLSGEFPNLPFPSSLSDMDEERLALLRAVAGLSTGTSEFISAQKRENERKDELYNELLTRLVDTLPMGASKSSASPASSGNPRFKEPFIFKGKASDVNDFLMLIAYTRCCSTLSQRPGH